ncbi:MAG: chorismate synthase, partial [Bacillota bacterium]|nr:chorismate synthase [Bacillota bacterium]
MGSTWGNKLKISIFGESHGEAIGVVIDGLPAGEVIDTNEILLQMSRRSPGSDSTSTPRKESDEPKIVSGILNGKTTGAPLCAFIENTNTRSNDYSELSVTPRPGHADYTGQIRYNGSNDLRGGGHFSGRLTAPLVFAGAVCRQILERKGILIGAHIFSIANVFDIPFDAANISKDLICSLSKSKFALIDAEKEDAIRTAVNAARAEDDSVGGIVECAAIGVPTGIGSPMFGGIENIISSIVFGIPAVKGIEFGNGFAAASLRGSENNDSFTYKNDKVVTETNNCGGILGGIS